MSVAMTSPFVTGVYRRAYTLLAMAASCSSRARAQLVREVLFLICRLVASSSTIDLDRRV